MTSNWYEYLSVMIILFLILKIIRIESFYIRNFKVETRRHKNKQKKTKTKHLIKSHIYEQHSALDNPQGSICHEPQLNQTKSIAWLNTSAIATDISRKKWE